MMQAYSPLNSGQSGIVLTSVEEQFLIETEKEQQNKPCFDARALRQIGLTQAEVTLLQVFFLKARSMEFNVRRFTKSECFQALISALSSLPRTGETGKITLDSYRLSDIDDRFRHDYGNALIHSHKERREPVLLAVLSKVFDWVEKFQKAHTIFYPLPQWLQDGMKGDFKTDSWIGSDLYEGDRTPAMSPAKSAQEAAGENTPQAAATLTQQRQSSDQATLFSARLEPLNQPHPQEQAPPATDKQKALLKKLMDERRIPCTSLDIDTLTKKEASRRIDELFQQNAEHRQEAAA